MPAHPLTLARVPSLVMPGSSPPMRTSSPSSPGRHGSNVPHKHSTVHGESSQVPITPKPANMRGPKRYGVKAPRTVGSPLPNFREVVPSPAVPSWTPSPIFQPKPSSRLPAFLAKDYDDNIQDPMLGVGGFAKIFRVVERATSQPFAMKVMDKAFYAARGHDDLLSNEIKGMKRAAACRFVVKLFDVCEDNEHVYLRMEMLQTNLVLYVNSLPGFRAEEGAVSKWGAQLFLGLQDIHDVGIVHRDVKPENLLLAHDGVLKIADFGWCADAAELSGKQTLAGTFQFMAPEVLTESTHTPAVDVWGAGATLFQLVTGVILLAKAAGCSTGLTLTDPVGASKVRISKFLTEIHEKCPLRDDWKPPHLSPTCWDSLRRMLQPSVEARISVVAALGHQWLRDVALAVEDVNPCQLRDQHRAKALPDLPGRSPAKTRGECSPGAPESTAWMFGSLRPQSPGKPPVPDRAGHSPRESGSARAGTLSPRSPPRQARSPLVRNVSRNNTAPGDLTDVPCASAKRVEESPMRPHTSRVASVRAASPVPEERVQLSKTGVDRSGTVVRKPSSATHFQSPARSSGIASPSFSSRPPLNSPPVSPPLPLGEGRLQAPATPQTGKRALLPHTPRSPTNNRFQAR